jgi:DNA polymerase-1
MAKGGRPGATLRWIGPDEVLEKFGVTPDKVIDVQALCGDAVDNVPGVPGIGVKTAAELINAYGDIETLLARADEIKQPARRQKLIDNAHLARVSKQLVTLSTDVPVELPLDALGRVPIEPAALFPFLKAMEFFALAKRFGTLLHAEPDAWEADPELKPVVPEPIGFDNAAKAEARAARLEASGQSDAAAIAHAAEVHAAIRAVPLDHSKYEIIRDRAALERWLKEIYRLGVVSVDTETTGLDAQQADLVGIALSTAPGNGAYVPVGHATGGDLLGGGRAEGQMDIREALALLKPMLEDRSILKIGHHIKYDLEIFARYGITVAAIDDTLLMTYVLDGARFNTMGELSEHWLGHAGIPIKELLGTGKAQRTFAEVPIEDAAKYAAEDADIAMRLWMILKPRLPAENMTALYETRSAPRPGSGAHGVAAASPSTAQILSRLSGDFAQRAAALEAEAYEHAGQPFNLGSPKQLGDILFDKLAFPAAQRPRPAPGRPAPMCSRSWRAGHAAGPRGARMAAADQAHGHLYRRAARLHQPAHRARAHELPARRRC